MLLIAQVKNRRAIVAVCDTCRLHSPVLWEGENLPGQWRQGYSTLLREVEGLEQPNVLKFTSLEHKQQYCSQDCQDRDEKMLSRMFDTVGLIQQKVREKLA